jgi:hypothetical protein
MRFTDMVSLSFCALSNLDNSPLYINLRTGQGRRSSHIRAEKEAIFHKATDKNSDGVINAGLS